MSPSAEYTVSTTSSTVAPSGAWYESNWSAPPGGAISTTAVSTTAGSTIAGSPEGGTTGFRSGAGAKASAANCDITAAGAIEMPPVRGAASETASAAGAAGVATPPNPRLEGAAAGACTAG